MKRNRIAALLIAFLLAFALLPMVASAASNAPSAKPESGGQASLSTVVRSFKLKYLRPRPLVATLADLYGPGVRTSVANDTIIVRTTPELMSSVAHLIAQRDTAEHVSPDLKIVVYLLYGSRKGEIGESVPRMIIPAVVQLRKTFAFQGYQLLDTVTLRTGTMGSTQAQTTGSFLLPSAAKEPVRSATYKLVVEGADANKTKDGYSISVGLIHLSAFFPAAPHISAGHFDVRTTMSLKEGQLAVLGKTSDGTPNAVMAVVTAEVLK